MAQTVNTPTSTSSTETINTTPAGLVDDVTNPLRGFRTYSYHFILIAMDTTEYLDVQNPLVNSLISDDKFYTRQDPISNPRIIVRDPNGIGQYCIFIDSRQDTDFIIEDVEWGTTFIGNSNSGDSAVGLNTFLTDGRMRIVEPRGVSFLNQLSALADPSQLNTDPSTMVFMLKVYFVGHNDDGSVTQITTVPPFGITFTELTGSVDANGTTYNISYCGVVNGSAWNKSYDAIVDQMTFTFTQGQSLQQHLDSFAAAINQKYKNNRDTVIQNYLKATNNQVNLSNTATIEWRLVLEPGSQELSKLKDFGTLTPLQQKVAGTSTIYPGTKEGGIAEVIDKLMNTSQEWTNVQISGNPAVKDFDNQQTRFAYKIATEFEKTSATKDNKFIVTYYISEYAYKVVQIVDSKSGGGNAQPVNISKGSVYEFDYIFTGKNIDIQRLEMNLSLGYALWISLVTSRGLASQTQDVTGSTGEAAIVQTRPMQSNIDVNQALRTGTPIWPTPVAKETSKKEYQSSASVAAADAIWRNYSSYQSMQAELTILGNPNLIQKITNPSRSGPDYVKINIKMPSTPDDIWEYNQSANNQPGGYYKTFWFNGYYNIITAKNKFIGGQFTQDLDLIQIPQVSSDMVASNALQAQQDNAAQNPQAALNPSTPQPQSPPPLNNVTTASGQSFTAGTPSPFIATNTTPTTQQVSVVPTTFNLLDQTVLSVMVDQKTPVKGNSND